MGLTNAQYDAIMRIYEQRKLHNKDILAARQQEVFHAIPQYQSLDRQISSLGVESAKLLMAGDTSALTSFQKRRKILTAQKEELLLQHGYPLDYLDPIYSCPDCQDTGYIQNKKCHCFKKEIIDQLYRQSNLDAILQQENFDTFSMEYYSPNFTDPNSGRTALDLIKEALEESHRFIDNFSTSFQNLFFYGNTGVGKTFLTHCIAKELLEKSFSVIYFTAFELFDILAKSNFQKDLDAAIVHEHIFDCDLLIIDDLGTEMTNSFTASQFFLCLNERILSQKSTIISTNLSLEQLVELYSERVFSRISSHYTMLRLTGDDIRIQKKFTKNREEK